MVKLKSANNELLRQVNEQSCVDSEVSSRHRVGGEPQENSFLIPKIRRYNCRVQPKGPTEMLLPVD